MNEKRVNGRETENERAGGARQARVFFRTLSIPLSLSASWAALFHSLPLCPSWFQRKRKARADDSDLVQMMWQEGNKRVPRGIKNAFLMEVEGERGKISCELSLQKEREKKEVKQKLMPMELFCDDQARLRRVERVFVHLKKKGLCIRWSFRFPFLHSLLVCFPCEPDFLGYHFVSTEMMITSLYLLVLEITFPAFSV